jgi:NADH-quinone oxidoreductase subunit N
MPNAELIPFLLPLILVCCGALATLGFEAFLGRHAKHSVLPWLAALFVAGAAAAQIFTVPGQVHQLFALDPARIWLCLAILGATMLSLGGLQASLARDDYPGGEPYPLALMAAAGAMLMVMAADTIALFIGLELASLSVYALVGMRRHRLDSNEALFKYFAMGAIFSAVFLYGAALTYGATGSTRFGIPAPDERTLLFTCGQTLMVIGLLFKVGSVPFHFWSPDAYTGAPAAVTGFMGAIIKVGGFAALGALWLNLVAITSGNPPVGVLALDKPVMVSLHAQAALGKFNHVFMILALLSLVLGNFSALRQTSARRLIAFSSIAHAGYMLLAFALPYGADQFQLNNLWFYLVGYALATSGALTALAALSGREESNDDLAGLAGQARARPFHGLLLTVFVVSFAGLPPTVGFLGKYLIFSDLVGKGQTSIAIFAMVMAVVGAAYYFRLLVTLWSGSSREGALDRVRTLSGWTLGAAALAVVALMMFPHVVVPVGQPAAKPAAAAP